MYINFQQNRFSRSVKTVLTNILANNRKLHKFTTTNSNLKQDAREAMRVVFSVLTKCICMHKTTFLRMYSNIVLKVILNCMNMQIATQLIMMYNL